MKESVVIVSFSARKHGNCENIADRLQAIFPEAYSIDFRSLPSSPAAAAIMSAFRPRACALRPMTRNRP